MSVRIHVGDALEVLSGMADESVQCCITSPPYWGLRAYKGDSWDGGDPECDHQRGTGAIDSSTLEGSKATVHGAKEGWPKGRCGKCGATLTGRMIGLEPTFDEHLTALVAVFREVRRVLRADGTIWLNYGDAYTSGNRASYEAAGNKGQTATDGQPRPSTPTGLKPKDLMMMPARVALALQQPFLQCRGCGEVAHESKWGRWPNGRRICPGCMESPGEAVETPGWWVRSPIVWHKPNPMPRASPTGRRARMKWSTC